MNRTEQLDRLFEEWRASYPPEVRGDFHNDGIVDENTFDKQRERVLFVLAEPNSRGGRYDRHRGEDLRQIFGYRKWRKTLNQSIARWTRLVLDGVASTAALSGRESDEQNRRIAIINLKKLAGSGTADVSGIAIEAWASREFLRRQIRAIQPTLMICCGQVVCSVLPRVLHDSPRTPPLGSNIQTWDGSRLIASFHPSLRNTKQHEAAMTQLMESCRAIGLLK